MEAITSEITEWDLQKILNRESFETIKSFSIRFLSEEKVLGFLGDHFLFRVVTSDKKFFEFFLKTLPHCNRKLREFIEATGFFERECEVYEYFIPKIAKLSSLKWNAKCFLVKNREFIFLEYLKDFKVVNSEALLFDFEHFEVAARYLASLHASFVIYEEKREKFSHHELQKLRELAYPKDAKSVRAIGFEKGVKALTELIKFIPKYKNSENLTFITKSFSEICQLLPKFVKTSRKFRNVLLHGDLWAHNFMFRYDRDNRPKECKIIDFQLSRFAPPAMDLTTFIYASSTKEFRDLHMVKILEVYCTQIEYELKAHDVSLKALPRAEILESFEEFKIAGLIEAAIFGHLTLLPSNLASNMIQSPEEYEKFISQCRVELCTRAFDNEIYRTRMTEWLTEIIHEHIFE